MAGFSCLTLVEWDEQNSLGLKSRTSNGSFGCEIFQHGFLKSMDVRVSNMDYLHTNWHSSQLFGPLMQILAPIPFYIMTRIWTNLLSSKSTSLDWTVPIFCTKVGKRETFKTLKTPNDWHASKLALQAGPFLSWPCIVDLMN